MTGSEGPLDSGRVADSPMPPPPAAAPQLAILKANYMAKRLGDHYPVLFTGKADTCAHEFILDVRPLEET
jgi:hypothetical protein